MCSLRNNVAKFSGACQYGWTRRGFLKSHGGDTRRRSNFPGRKSGGRRDWMKAGIPSSADYLCTSSRDSFHCNGAKSRERSESEVKPTEKCFYLARLSSLLKVRFFRESRAGHGPERTRHGATLPRKRDCGLLTTTSPPAFSYISYLCFSFPPSSSPAFRSNGSRDTCEGWMAATWGGKWEKLRQLPADFGI